MAEHKDLWNFGGPREKSDRDPTDQPVVLDQAARSEASL
jgi:hypothetical protein